MSPQTLKLRDRAQPPSFLPPSPQRDLGKTRGLSPHGDPDASERGAPRLGWGQAGPSAILLLPVVPAGACSSTRTHRPGLRAGSPGRAGLLTALPLAVVRPAQGVTVSLVHRPKLPLSAVHTPPLQACRATGLSQGQAPTQGHPNPRRNSVPVPQDGASQLEASGSSLGLSDPLCTWT